MLTTHFTQRHRLTLLLSLILGHAASPNRLRGDDWMTWPSTYTHEPLTGRPVDQYSPGVQPVAPHREDFVRSGYRQFRSTLQVGQSADNMHIVEQWGQPVVPYEAWRFPFRPYGVPYDAWGPPVGIANPWGGGFPGGGFPGGGFPGGGFPGGGFPGHPGFGFPPAIIPLQPNYQGQPWYDGTYPDAPPLDPRSDQEFFYRPPKLGQ